METKNILLIFAAVIVLLLAGIIAGNSVISNENNTQDNDSMNISLNDSENNTTTAEKVTTKNTKTEKSKDQNIVGESIKENYQEGDGSHYREVQYKDGNIRQYNSKGELIGSTFDSDQAQLREKYGDMS